MEEVKGKMVSIHTVSLGFLSVPDFAATVHMTAEMIFGFLVPKAILSEPSFFSNTTLTISLRNIVMSVINSK